MSRPRYENEESQKNEERFCVAQLPKDLTVVKLPISYVVDFAVYDSLGNLNCFIEYKRRFCNRTKYSSYIISLRKFLAAKELAAKTLMPVFLVVEWEDYTGVLQITQEYTPLITNGGRHDRGDWQDEEPVVHIPIAVFRPVEEYLLRLQ